MKKFLSLLLLPLLVACENPYNFMENYEPQDDVAVTGISLIEHEIEATIGDVFTLDYEITPHNATNKNVTWSIEDESLVSQTNSTKFRALAAGETTITITTSDVGYTDTAYINISSSCVDEQTICFETLSFDYYPESMPIGTSAQVYLDYTPSNANESVTFSSLNPSIISINQNGVVTALSEGTAVIRVQSDITNIRADATIEVISDYVPVESIGLNAISPLELTVGESYQFEATITPSNATYQTVYWYSESITGSNVISLSNAGYATALTVGRAYVAAYTDDPNGVYNYIIVEVTDGNPVVHVESVTLDLHSVIASVGDEFALTATVEPYNADNQEVYWESSNNSVASVDDYGYVTVLSTGECYIYVVSSDNGLYDSCYVQVYNNSSIIGVDLIDNDNILTSESTDSDSLTSTSVNKNELSIASTSYYSSFDSKKNTDNKYFGVYRYAVSGNNLLLRASGRCNKAAIYNTSALYGIRVLNLTYTSNSDFDILFGNGVNHYSASVTVKPGSNKSVTLNVNSNSYSYFKVEGSANSDLTFISATIKYENNSNIYIDTSKPRISQGNRATFTPNYNPSEGDTITVGNKTYTYHSTEYVLNQYYSNQNGFNPSQYSYTTELDVANYYTAFNAWPANYFSTYKEDGMISDWYDGGEVYVISNTYRNIFGDYARVVSQYSRTNGYATAIPYRVVRDNAPLYYEFDIDVDGTYSTNNRGVGRVVGWSTGFSCYNDQLNVCLFTDDHYLSFRESLNNGTWGELFTGNSSPEYVNRLYWC